MMGARMNRNTVSTKTNNPIGSRNHAIGLALLLGTASFGVSPVQAQDSANTVKKDEIIVTATKRAQPLLEVPISMSVFDTQTLDQIAPNSLSDLMRFAGNVYMPPAGEAGRSAITIRGLGAGVNKTAGDAVGLYVDGVYINAATALDMDIYNVENIEVLRGPQGTLFGRDTIGGAVLVTTKSPDGTFDGNVELTLGRFNQSTLSANMDIPLYEDKLGLRLTGRQHHRDGHIFNEHNGQYLGEENHAGLGATLYVAPTDKWNARIAYEYRHRDDRPNAAGEPTTNIGSDEIPYTVNQDFVEQEYQTVNRASLNLEYDLGGDYTLNTLIGVTNVRESYIQDGDRLPDAITVQRFDDDTNTLSGEMRLSSPNFSRGDFLVGAYYFQSDERYSPTFPLMGTAFLEQVLFIPAAFHPADELDGQVIQTHTQTFAGFAHGNFNLTDAATLFGGVRLTQDNKRVDYHEFGEVFAIFGLPELRHVTKTENTPFSWTFGARYAVTPQINTYASASRGYRSISVKDDFVSQADIDAGTGFFTKPEFVTNYELGAKTRWQDGKIKADISLFYMDYTDIQVSVSDSEFSFLRSLTNAAKAHVEGFEIDTGFDLGHGFDLAVNLGYLKSRYDDFEPSPGDDRSGTGFGNAPVWTIGASLDYQHEIHWESLPGTLDWHFDFTQFTAPDDFVFDTLAFVGDYGLANTALSYQPRNHGWGIEFWVQNLFDVNKPRTNFHWGAGLGPLLDNVTVQYERPRTYGVSVNYTFGRRG